MEAVGSVRKTKGAVATATHLAISRFEETLTGRCLTAAAAALLIASALATVGRRDRRSHPLGVSAQDGKVPSARGRMHQLWLWLGLCVLRAP